jgi:lipoate-protein ligase A
VFHGEYKMPGGKLVIVEFRLDGNRLCDVVVSGDFFLYPDEVLFDITGALEGMPADLDETNVAARVEAAIPAGAEVLGTSPEGIAIAARRALEGAGAP